jgi:hypothetical protein
MSFWRLAKNVAIALLCCISSSLFLVATSTAAFADTATFTSAQIGTSGQTPEFSQSGNWTMFWTYNCSTFTAPHNFIIKVNQPAGDPTIDIGTNELGPGDTGAEYYFDSGAFSLSVSSDAACTWSISVLPYSAPPDPYTTTYSSALTGSSGNTRQFLEQGPWAMSWSYDCPSGGKFIVYFDQTVPNEATLGMGPNQLGTGGSGLYYYDDSAVFSLAVNSVGCSWTINIYGNLPQPVDGVAASPDGGGYWLTDAAGGVSPHGDAANYGSMAFRPLAAPINHIVATPDGRGYWLVGADGGVFTFGDAGFYGSMAGKRLDAPVVDIAPTSDGRGYWLVASDGGVFAFGDAAFEGSMGGRHLNKPVIGIASDYATGGYWLVAADGGIFAFNAPFEGSTGNIALTQPVKGISATPNDSGYWLVASDGGIFAFNAPFFGSLSGQRLDAPLVGIAADEVSGGYWLVGADGGIITVNAPFLGAD